MSWPDSGKYKCVASESQYFSGCPTWPHSKWREQSVRMKEGSLHLQNECQTQAQPVDWVVMKKYVWSLIGNLQFFKLSCESALWQGFGIGLNLPVRTQIMTQGSCNSQAIQSDRQKVLHMSPPCVQRRAQKCWLLCNPFLFYAICWIEFTIFGNQMINFGIQTGNPEIAAKSKFSGRKPKLRSTRTVLYVKTPVLC